MERQQKLQKIVEQASKFEVLQSNVNWDFFRKYMESARDRYLATTKLPGNRDNHLTLARALEGYDAINNILEGFDRTINEGVKARKELTEETDATRTKSGRPVR